MRYENRKPIPWAAKTREKYESLIEPLRARARELGYAIAVHGSLERDIDIIAVPWTGAAIDARDLVRELVEVVYRVNGAAYVRDDPPEELADAFDWTRRNPQPKPHGRLAWSIHLGGGPYIDLSVMPRKT